jgi:hypothetical protein
MCHQAEHACLIFKVHQNRSLTCLSHQNYKLSLSRVRICVCMMLGMEPSVLQMLGKRSATELHLQPTNIFTHITCYF